MNRSNTQLLEAHRTKKTDLNQSVVSGGSPQLQPLTPDSGEGGAASCLLPSRVVVDGQVHEVPDARSSDTVEHVTLEGRVFVAGGELPFLAALFPHYSLTPDSELDDLVRQSQWPATSTGLDWFLARVLNVLSEAHRRDQANPTIAQVFGAIDAPAHAVLESATVRGLALDEDGLVELEEELCDEQLAVLLQVREQYRDVDPDKDEHVERTLRDALNVRVEPDGTLSGCRLPLRRDIKVHAKSNPMAKLLHTYRDASALLDQSARLSAVGTDGRLHPRWAHPVLCNTGRINMKGSTAVSNVRKKLRRYIKADDGFVFVVADWTTFELCVLAELSGEAGLLNSLLAGEDLHAAVASELFGVPRDDVVPSQRALAKTINFALPFGQTSYGIAMHAGISNDKALAYMHAFAKQYPSLHNYQRTLKSRTDATVTLKSGRVLPLGRQGVSTKDLERRRIAYSVQGTAADIAKTALVSVQNALQSKDLGHVAIFLHDEIVAQVPEDKAEEASRVIKQIMETPPTWMPKIPLLVTPDIRKTWGSQ